MFLKKNNLLKNILPQWCYSCKNYLEFYSESGLCSACSEKLPWWNSDICGNCLEPLLYCYRCKDQPSIYPIFAYEKLISSWLTSLKYNRNFYAARLFQKLIRIWLRQNPHFLEKYDFVVPLPTHPYKFFLRGFNPSSYLIKNLFDTKKLINIADKTRWTKPQTSLQYYQRIKILNKKIFQISDKVKEKKVLVFDDVVTTKSSVLNLVRQIKKKKAKEVDVLCLARVFL